ncbi:hypothetical protein BV25DRAFT_1812471 [Artomyces pyxidatus]|uniref:Uncharacterized protein n=1 Tax=Artomyces pyxidatus TaxID=48021 RepID=A0ACB8SLP5_9AGAM|nr:hypothetical protein BV25DRAFT_1812471 [Artomyces pyxidatus]
MGQIPIDVATLVSLLCAGVLYGIHLVTFGNVARVLLVQRNAARRRPRVYLVVATLLLLFIGSAHIVILMRRVLEAFVWYTGPGGATTALYQISNKLLNTMSILYDTQTAIGDIILVYRCYVLYRRDWRVVVLPVALWVNFLVFAVLNVHKALNLREQALLSTGSLETWATAGLSMTLALNVVTTGLMVFKIWSIQRQSTRIFGPSGRLSGRRSLDDVIIILVESGAIYTFAVVLFVALNTSQNNAEFPFAAGVRALYPPYAIHTDSRPQIPQIIVRLVFPLLTSL